MTTARTGPGKPLRRSLTRTRGCGSFDGSRVEAWRGPGRGTQTIKGEDFRPYLPTSASPEHISGHSSFSAAAATAIRLALSSDALGFETTVRANSFKVETGPAQDVRLRWDTQDDEQFGVIMPLRDGVPPQWDFEDVEALAVA